jgi:hypothetical protein
LKISPRALNRTPSAPNRLFQSNPAHPGLQFKKLEGEDNIYSVRIGLEYHALAILERSVVSTWDASTLLVAANGAISA